MSAPRRARARTSSTTLKALRVLEAVAAQSRVQSLSEITAAVALDKTSVHRLLATLVEAGYVRQDPDSRRYTLSYRVVTLSRNLLADSEVMRLARSTLQALAAETGEGAHLEVLDGMEAVLVQHVKGSQLVAVDFQVGDRSQLHTTSIGKVLLAYQDPQDIQSVIAAGLPSLTAYTIVSPEALLDELNLVRERGYAIDDRETHEYMRCISTPVFERDGPLRMGLSISGPDSRFTLEYLDGLREPMLRASRELSRQLGGIGAG